MLFDREARCRPLGAIGDDLEAAVRCQPVQRAGDRSRL